MLDDAELTPDALAHSVNEILGRPEHMQRMREALEHSGAGSVAEDLAARIIATITKE